MGRKWSFFCWNTKGAGWADCWQNIQIDMDGRAQGRSPGRDCGIWINQPCLPALGFLCVMLSSLLFKGTFSLDFCCCFQRHPKQHIHKLSHTFNNSKPSCSMLHSSPLLQTSSSLPGAIPFYPDSDFFSLSPLIFQPLLETPSLLFPPGWRKRLWILTISNFACLHIYTFLFL